MAAAAAPLDALAALAAAAPGPAGPLPAGPVRAAAGPAVPPPPAASAAAAPPPPRAPPAAPAAPAPGPGLGFLPPGALGGGAGAFGYQGVDPQQQQQQQQQQQGMPQPGQGAPQLPSLVIPGGGFPANPGDTRMPTSPSSPVNKLKVLPNFIDSYNKQNRDQFTFKKARDDQINNINPYKIYRTKQDEGVVPNSVFEMVSAIPDCEPTRAKSGLPSSVIVTPYMDDTTITIDGDPERCARCRAYRCSMCEVNKAGWICAFCGRKNKENTNNKMVYNKSLNPVNNFLNAPSPQSVADSGSNTATASHPADSTGAKQGQFDPMCEIPSFLPPGFDASSTAMTSIPELSNITPGKTTTSGDVHTIYAGTNFLPSIVDYVTDSEDYIYRPPLAYGKIKDFVQPTTPLKVYQEEVGFGTAKPQPINPIVHVVLIDMSLPSLRSGLAKATIGACKSYLLSLKGEVRKDKCKRILFVTIDGQYAVYRQITTRRKYQIHAGSITQWSLDGSSDTVGTANLKGSQALSAPETGTPGIPLPMEELCPILSNEPYIKKEPTEKRSTIDMELEILKDIETEMNDILTKSNNPSSTSLPNVPGGLDSIYYAIPGVSVASYITGIACSLRNIGGRITLSVAESIGSVCESTNLFYDVASICRACGVCVDCICLKTERNVRAAENNNISNNYACLLCPLCYRTGGHFFFDSSVPIIPNVVINVPQNNSAGSSLPLSTGVLDRILAFITNCLVSHVALNVTMITRMGSTLSYRKTCGFGTAATAAAFGKMIIGNGNPSSLANYIDKKVLLSASEDNESQADVILVPGIYSGTAYEVYYKSESPIPSGTTSVTFQTAMLFTSSRDGRRHVRVITKSIPVVTTSIDLTRQINQTALIYSSAVYAAQRIFEYCQDKHSTSMAAESAISEAIKKTHDDVTNYRLVYPLSVYKKEISVQRNESVSDSSTILLLPDCMQYAPASFLGLLKRQLFLSNNLSYVAADAMKILATPPLTLCRECYPAVIDVAELIASNRDWKKGDNPKIRLLRPCSLLLPPLRTSALLVWVGGEMSIYVGSEFDNTLLHNIFGIDSFSQLRSGTYYTTKHTHESDLLLVTMSLLSSVPPTTIAYRCTVIPEGPLYPFFATHLIEDKFNGTGSLLEYLGLVQSRIMARVK